MAAERVSVSAKVIKADGPNNLSCRNAERCSFAELKRTMVLACCLGASINDELRGHVLTAVLQNEPNITVRIQIRSVDIFSNPNVAPEWADDEVTTLAKR